MRIIFFVKPNIKNTISGLLGLVESTIMIITLGSVIIDLTFRYMCWSVERECKKKKQQAG